MRKTVLLLTLIFATCNLFSQKKDTTIYNNGLTVNFEALTIKDIMLTYTHRISKKNYVETMLAYRIAGSSPTGLFTILGDGYHFKDPYFYYGRFQLRVGLKHYFNHFYISPNFLYSNGYFEKGGVLNYSYYCQELSRNKNELEFFIKTGLTVRVKHFLQDFYIGVGYRYKFLNDLVYEDGLDGDMYYDPDKTYPYKIQRTMKIVTLHVGCQFGYCK